MDAKIFYDTARKLLKRRFTQSQVDGINMILEVGDHLENAPLAYVLATSAWETGWKFQPVREIGKGKGRPYGLPVGPYNQIYYGRGDVQLTWLRNYQLASRMLGTDLVQFPDRALENRTSKLILVTGMEEGWFTGKKLDDYFTPGKADFIEARRIVNGVDKRDEIAAIARSFHAALVEASRADLQPELPLPAPTPPAPVPPPKETPVENTSPKGHLRSLTIIGALLTLVSAFGLFGMSYDPATMTITIKLNTLLEAVAAVGVPGGALLSWFGRWRAVSPIKGLL